MSRTDDGLDDAFVDAQLEERLGGEAPADVATIVFRGGSGRSPARRRAPALAAAALVVLGVAVVVAVRATQRDRETGTTATEQDPQPAPATRPIRVLQYVEELPRWTFRYARNALLRSRASHTRTFLTSAGTDFVQEHSEGTPALTDLPTTAEALAAFDVVLLGDVPPAPFGADPDAQRGFVGALAAFVRDGGGLGVLCGERSMPQAWRDTGLPELLPVGLRERPLDTADGRVVGFVPAGERGTRHGILDGVAPLVDRDGAPAEEWPMVGFHRWLGSPRDDATVVVDAGGRPLVAVRRVGRGRVLLVGTEDVWRIRSTGDHGSGAAAHDRFWVNAVGWLAGRGD